MSQRRQFAIRVNEAITDMSGSSLQERPDSVSNQGPTSGRD